MQQACSCPSSAATLLGVPTIHLVPQNVFRNRKQPGAEPRSPSRIEAIDRPRERRQRVLSQIFDRGGTDLASSPSGELGTDDGAEDRPEFKPGFIVTIPKFGDERGGEWIGMHQFHDSLVGMMAQRLSGNGPDLSSLRPSPAHSLYTGDRSEETGVMPEIGPLALPKTPRPRTGWRL